MTDHAAHEHWILTVEHCREGDKTRATLHLVLASGEERALHPRDNLSLAERAKLASVLRDVAREMTSKVPYLLESEKER